MGISPIGTWVCRLWIAQLKQRRIRCRTSLFGHSMQRFPQRHVADFLMRAVNHSRAMCGRKNETWVYGGPALGWPGAVDCRDGGRRWVGISPSPPGRSPSVAPMIGASPPSVVCFRPACAPTLCRTKYYFLTLIVILDQNIKFITNRSRFYFMSILLIRLVY